MEWQQKVPYFGTDYEVSETCFAYILKTLSGPYHLNPAEENSDKNRKVKKHEQVLLPPANEVRGKVMFLHRLSASHSVHGGRMSASGSSRVVSASGSGGCAHTHGHTPPRQQAVVRVLLNAFLFTSFVVPKRILFSSA